MADPAPAPPSAAAASAAAPADPLSLPSWLGGGKLAASVIHRSAPVPQLTLDNLQAEFPHLKIEAQIGRGGMGVVYRAVDLITSRQVALKVLLEEHLESSPEYHARFQQEAEVMQRLQHPHIVRLQRVGTTPAGWPYLLMEYIEGTDIAQKLRKEKRFPPALALQMCQQVTSALAYAHSLGVIHRDIKPSNILLAADDQVKIADFGLARREDEVGHDGLTQSFHTMGSQDYQAPEMLLVGAAVDERADLYAVGIMLYQMLVSFVPRGIFHLPSKIHPDLDPRFDTILTSLLQQNPYERTASALDLLNALEEIATTPFPSLPAAPAVPAASTARPRWWPFRRQ
jgi:serine/threonine protein kinase